MYKCAGGSSNEKVSQIFFLAPNVYFTDRKMLNMDIFRVVKEGFGIMNAKFTFSDAPYWNKRSLKISNHLVVICVFYRPEGDHLLQFFMVQNHKIEGIFTMQCD